MNLPRVLSLHEEATVRCAKRVPGQAHPRLSSTSKAEDLWTTRLGTTYCHGTPFSLIIVALCAVQNSVLDPDIAQGICAVTRVVSMPLAKF